MTDCRNSEFCGIPKMTMKTMKYIGSLPCRMYRMPKLHQVMFEIDRSYFPFHRIFRKANKNVIIYVIDIIKRELDNNRVHISMRYDCISVIIPHLLISINTKIIIHASTEINKFNLSISDLQRLYLNPQSQSRVKPFGTQVY